MRSEPVSVNTNICCEHLLASSQNNLPD